MAVIKFSGREVRISDKDIKIIFYHAKLRFISYVDSYDWGGEIPKDLLERREFWDHMISECGKV